MARVDYTTDSETDSRLNPAEQAKFDQISAGSDSGSELSDREKDAINLPFQATVFISHLREKRKVQ